VVMSSAGALVSVGRRATLRPVASV
jgi:hypothetical protein